MVDRVLSSAHNKSGTPAANHDTNTWPARRILEGDTSCPEAETSPDSPEPCRRRISIPSQSPASFSAAPAPQRKQPPASVVAAAAATIPIGHRGWAPPRYPTIDRKAAPKARSIGFPAPPPPIMTVIEAAPMASASSSGTSRTAPCSAEIHANPPGTPQLRPLRRSLSPSHVFA